MRERERRGRARERKKRESKREKESERERDSWRHVEWDHKPLNLLHRLILFLLQYTVKSV